MMNFSSSVSFPHVVARRIDVEIETFFDNDDARLCRGVGGRRSPPLRTLLAASRRCRSGDGARCAVRGGGGAWLRWPFRLLPPCPVSACERRAGRAGVGCLRPGRRLCGETPHPGPPLSRFAKTLTGRGGSREEPPHGVSVDDPPRLPPRRAGLRPRPAEQILDRPYRPTAGARLGRGDAVPDVDVGHQCRRVDEPVARRRRDDALAACRGHRRDRRRRRGVDRARDRTAPTGWRWGWCSAARWAISSTGSGWAM